MFKPISNPYIVGNPIKTADMFFGRQDDFDFIKRKLESGQKSYIIVLCGERRSGKTSILFQILSGRLGESFIPILIDMQTMAGLQNEREFFEKFAEETLKCVDEKIELSAFFKNEGSSFKAFSAFLNDIHKRNKNKHILFLVDEYELIEAKIGEGSLSENFIPYLAGLLEGDQLISFLFTGSSKLEDRKSTLWQILFAKSLFRDVSYLSRDDTLRLIAEPVKGKIEFSLDVLNIIYRLTYGQPFYTQVVCQNIVDYVNQKQQILIHEEDLDLVVNEILENPLPQMIYFWNSLPDDRKLILSLMAEILEGPNAWIKAEEIIKESRQRKFGLDLNVKSINITLETLFHSQHVGKSQSGYKFQMDLFRRWIKRDHAIWRVMKEVSTLGMASSVERQVYERDSESQKKSKKWLPLVAGLVVILLAGWWIMKPAEEHTETQANKEEHILESPAVENNKTVNPKSAEIPKEKNKEPEIKIESPAGKAGGNSSGSSAEKKQPANKTTTERLPPKTAEQPVVDKAAENDAFKARQKMIDERAEAIKNSDPNSSIIIAAQNKEKEANDNLSQKNFKQAEADFLESANLYSQANENSKKAATALSARVLEEKNKMLAAKVKLKDEHTLVDGFSDAQSDEKNADKFIQEQKYQEAISAYVKATRSYNQVLLTYNQNTTDITTAINGYLDAIQDESIPRMKQYYTNFSKSLENDWQQLFTSADNINVGRKIESIQLKNKTAQALVDVMLTFRGLKKADTIRWRIDLENSASGWKISGISEGH